MAVTTKQVKLGLIF